MNDQNVVSFKIRQEIREFVEEIHKSTGGNYASIIGAMAEYAVRYRKEEIKDFLEHHVGFYSRGFTIK